jgi:ABC-type dipeptide/oligopeptide/nickel transport system permease component
MKILFITIAKRIFSMLITLLAVTALLYATVMFTPPETRATLYFPRETKRLSEAQMQKMIDRIIEENHLADPYPVQYYYWLRSLLRGDWGYSPVLQEDVFSAIARRAPATAELTIFSILVFIPLGLISGVIAGSKRNKLQDHGFRISAFIATSMPPFILALILMAIFYIDLHWFAPGRITTALGFQLNSTDFRQITGLLTIDGLLNHRPDITLDALRHLAMPVFTLAIAHWATLGRVTRAEMIEETAKDYVVAARARGIPEPRITWRHTLRNAFAPALTSSVLSAASLVTGVFVIEIIYNFNGISDVAVSSMAFVPDAPAALGFSIYSVFVVLLLMVILDLIQSRIDPRLRERE